MTLSNSPRPSTATLSVDASSIEGLQYLRAIATLILCLAMASLFWLRNLVARVFPSLHGAAREVPLANHA